MSRFEDIWALWQTGFPEDSEEYARAFWEAVGKDARCLFLHEGERPVSMAFLIPATLWDGERDWPIWYVYAAVTTRTFAAGGILPVCWTKRRTWLPGKGWPACSSARQRSRCSGIMLAVASQLALKPLFLSGKQKNFTLKSIGHR